MGESLQIIHEWQGLLGAIIVALALMITVGWILGSEGRRRHEETKSLRMALGTELRIMARHALTVEESVLKLLPSVNPHIVSPTRTLEDLQNVVRFPDAVIYLYAGPSLGSLGTYASDVVLFHLQIWKIRDSVAQLRSVGSPDLGMMSVPSAQLLDVAASLLSALDTAIGAFPGLAYRRSSSPDHEFTAEVSEARERLAGLKKSFAFRA